MTKVTGSVRVWYADRGWCVFDSATLIRFSALDVGGKSEIRIDTWAIC